MPGTTTRKNDLQALSPAHGGEQSNATVMVNEVGKFDECDLCGQAIPSKKSAGLKYHQTRWCKANPKAIENVKRSKVADACKSLKGEDTISKPYDNRVDSNEFLAVQDLPKDKEKHHITWELDNVFASKCDMKLDKKELDKVVKKPNPKLPHPNDRRKWRKYDDTIYETLITTIPQGFLDHGDYDDVVNQFTATVYDKCVDLGGVQKKQPLKDKHKQMNLPRKLSKLKRLKKDLRKELRGMKRTQEGDFHGVYQKLQATLRSYSRMKKSEESARKENQAVSERQKFRTDPYKYAKQVLKPRESGKPTFSKQTAEEHCRKTYCHPERKRPYSPPFNLPRPPEPSVPFETEFLNLGYDGILNKKRNGSASGLNGNRYLVYKRCPKVRTMLYKIYQRLWKLRKTPLGFRLAWQLQLPKSENTSHPSEMRPITILNSEARLYWSGFERKLSSFMLQNKYIRSVSQKAFIRGVAGCIEHATILREMFKDAKQRTRAICVVWSDLANAYGSVAHQMVAFALKWFHVPYDMIDMLMDYYALVMITMVTDEWTSEFFPQEIGVLQGCTAATSVFNVAFQLVMDIHAHLTKDLDMGYTIGDTSIKIESPLYADDGAFVQRFPDVAQAACDAFSHALAWSVTMSAKPAKWRSLAFRKFYKGEKQTLYKPEQATVYSSFDPCLKVRTFDEEGKIVQEYPIKFIGHDKTPIFKYLGMKLEANLSDRILRELVLKRLTDHLEKVDATLLTGPEKAWIVDNLVCQMESWDLLIHDLPTSEVKKLHKHIHAKYRKWIGLAKSAEASILYRPTNRFGLGFVHLVDKHQQLQVIKWHIMKYSDDPNSSGLYKYVLQQDAKGFIGTGRKTTPRLQLEKAERQVVLDEMLSTQRGTGGIGTLRKPPTDKKGRRKLVIARLKAEATERRLTLLHGYEMQNNWMHYALDEQINNDLTWKKVLTCYSEDFLKFVINGTTNTLNTPDNLRRWKISKDVTCGLCGKLGATLKHILAGCPWVFEIENKSRREDRYTWRHNCVLLVLARAIIAKIAVVNKRPEKTKQICEPQVFVKAGSRPKTTKRQPAPSIIEKARDWTYNFDLPELHHGKCGGLTFPCDIVITKRRIDGYVLSRQKKICILGPEVTAPMDDNVYKWHKVKTEKYRLDTTEAVGWTFHDCSLEVGALGWIPPSNRPILKSLGFTSPEIKLISDDMTLIARRCSYVIYLNRFNKDFEPYRITPRSTEKAVVGEYFDDAQTEKPQIEKMAVAAQQQTAGRNSDVLTPAQLARIATNKEIAQERLLRNKSVNKMDLRNNMDAELDRRYKGLCSPDEDPAVDDNLAELAAMMSL